MSSKAGWAIRIYEPEDRIEVIDYVSNFKNFASRQKDDVIVFKGIYGIGDYMIWIYDGALDTGFDISSAQFEVKLFLHENKEIPYWHEHYRCIDVTYDPNEQKYIIYAESLMSLTLRTKVSDKRYPSLIPSFGSFDTPKNTFEVLYELLQKNDIMGVFYDGNENDLINYGPRYKTVNVDLNWTIYDLIDYFTANAGFEWYYDKGILWISKELRAYQNKTTRTQVKQLETFIGSGVFFKKINGNPRPIDIMGHISSAYRCVWCKHIAGASGGMSKGCYVPIGSGALDKHLYFNSLEAEKEIVNANYLFARNNRYSTYVSVGSVMKDLEKEYINEISINRNTDGDNEVLPHEVKIDRGTGGLDLVPMLEKFNVSRMSPYVDNGAGMMFPSVETTVSVPPNSVILNVDGKIEAPINIGYLFGNGRSDFNVPLKKPKDLRLKMPDGDVDSIKRSYHGGNIYWDEIKNQWIIEGDSIVFRNTPTKYSEIPIDDYNDSGCQVMMSMFTSNTILLENAMGEIKLWDKGCVWLRGKNNEYEIWCHCDTGIIEIKATKSIELSIVEAETTVTKASLTATGLDIT